MTKLVKKNKKSVDVVVFEIDNNLLRSKSGKLGRSMSSSSTINCGSPENAILELQMLIEEHLNKGFVFADGDESLIDYEIFDKAKWHLNDGFPKELGSYQAYVHTGLFIGWLIMGNLTSVEFSDGNESEVKKFLDKQQSSTIFYQNILDGVFDSNDVNETGYQFTKSYFDFQNGQYLDDYENILASDLPTIFHVHDTWENFEKISSVIENRFNDWLVRR
ncbi:MAG: hypothetical protein EOP48_19720 [Sphingobacteriales bacterium]|nr:MAG: hypothetical protein EOP48_19720 [Sphingobacteriales bacterium]